MALSGEIDGSLTPCGCSSPMLGGLARRVSLLNGLPRNLIRLENGDLVVGTGRQDELKADTAIQALNVAKYDAFNLGERDFALGLDYLRSLQVRSTASFLCANAVDAEGNPLFASEIDVHRSVDGKQATITIVGLLSDSLFEGAQTPGVSFQPAVDTLAQIVNRWRSTGKAQLRILLYHGPTSEAEELAKRFPQLDLIVTAHNSDDPIAPRHVGSTVIASEGTEGKHLGLAHLSSGPNWHVTGFEDRAIGPALHENAAVRSAISSYERRVVGEGLLEQVARTPTLNGDRYAGTGTCLSCHEEAARKWRGSKHARAFATLTSVDHDGDPECVRCHVVGFSIESGYVSPKATPAMRDVGCESCHGPAAGHVRNPQHKLGAAGPDSCRSCHVPSHSPKFDFTAYWKRINH